MLQIGLRITFKVKEQVYHGEIVGFAGDMAVAVTWAEEDNRIWDVPIGCAIVNTEATRKAYLDAFRSMTRYNRSIRDYEERLAQGKPAPELSTFMNEYEKADALTRRIEAWAGAVAYELPSYSVVKAYCETE